MQTYAEFQPTGFDSRGLNARSMGDEGDEDRSAWLVLPVMQTRDSGPLDRSNFRSAVRELGGEGADVEVHRFGHWGPGWFDYCQRYGANIFAARRDEIPEDRTGELISRLAE